MGASAPFGMNACEGYMYGKITSFVTRAIRVTVPTRDPLPKGARLVWAGRSGSGHQVDTYPSVWALPPALALQPWALSGSLPLQGLVGSGCAGSVWIRPIHVSLYAIMFVNHRVQDCDREGCAMPLPCKIFVLQINRGPTTRNALGAVALGAPLHYKLDWPTQLKCENYVPNHSSRRGTLCSLHQKMLLLKPIIQNMDTLFSWNVRFFPKAKNFGAF